MVRIHVGQPISPNRTMDFELPNDAISPGDLAALLSSGTDDPRHGDIKPHLPPLTDSGREEFLNDIASFANADGGHLLYGASKGEEPLGLEKYAVDDAIAWLGQAAHQGIAPRIPGLRFKALELPGNRWLLAVRIPKTWAGPHMVMFREANRFFTRDAKGRCLLDVAGVRAAFALSETCVEKIRSFRLDRVNAILNHSLTVRLSQAPKTVLHILPTASFQPGFCINLEGIESGATPLPRPMAARGLSTHYNYDGLITFSSMEKYAFSYLQIFRNGCLEALESLMLEPRDGRKIIPAASFEKEIIACGERMVGMLQALHLEPPYVVMLSFLGVLGYNMFAGPLNWGSQAHPIERELLFLDEVVMNDSTEDFAKCMRPIFNHVWNSCGWPKSLNYDDAGNWRPSHS